MIILKQITIVAYIDAIYGLKMVTAFRKRRQQKSIAWRASTRPRKSRIWRSTGKIFSEEDHQKITELLLQQVLAYLTFENVTPEQRTDAEAAIAKAQKSLSNKQSTLATFLSTSSHLKQIVENLSK